MKVALYSDDSSAAHAAVLTADALARVAPTVLLVHVPAEGTRTGDLIRTAPLPNVEVAQIRMDEFAARAVCMLLDEATGAGREVVLALPLALLGTPEISNRVDLRVLPCGRDFMAANKMSRIARHPGDANVAPWILACDVQPGVPSCSQLGLVLPVAMPCLCDRDVRGIMGGTTTTPLQRRAVLMTAAMVAASASPRQPLDRPAFARLLGDAEVAPAKQQSLLRALAETYDRLLPETAEARAQLPRSPVRRTRFARSAVDTRRHARAPGAAHSSQANRSDLTRLLRA